MLSNFYILSEERRLLAGVGSTLPLTTCPLKIRVIYDALPKRLSRKYALCTYYVLKVTSRIVPGTELKTVFLAGRGRDCRYYGCDEGGVADHYGCDGGGVEDHYGRVM